MKILYDYQIFQAQKIGGISRYFSALLDEIIDAEIKIKYSENLYLKNIGAKVGKLFPIDYEYNRFCHGLHFRGKRKIFNAIGKMRRNPINDNKELSITAIKKSDFDIFHPTYYDPYFLDYLKDKPFVLTVFDMIHEKFPEFFSLNDSISKNKKILIENATMIIAISESTKSDIIKYYRTAEEKIKVVYLASSLIKNTHNKSSSAIPREYLLFIGSRGGYKNFHFMIRSISRLLRENQNLFLVCTGKGFLKEEEELFDSLGIREKLIHCFAEEDSLYNLYCNAKCLIFPSYSEGFGIPILEAFEAECPAILANIECTKEIAGNAALYFEPKDSLGLVSMVESVLNDGELVRKLKRRGQIRLKQYSWLKTIKNTEEVYRMVLNR